MVSAIQVVLDDRMRVALDGLEKSAVRINQAIMELRVQDYATEADALQVILDSLLAEMDLIKIAIAA